MRRLAGLLVMTLLGCDGPPAPIDVTVVAGPSLSSADLARIRFLDFTVSGAETAQAMYPLSTPFADHRQERVAYNARRSSGTASFSVDARDGASKLIANGQAQISLGSGAPRLLTIEIDLPVVIGDGGVGDGPTPPDLSIPDLAGICGGQPDGAGCGIADACNAIPTCLRGVCTAHPVADGLACGAADSCHSAPTCVAGTCTPHPLADGTGCGAADPCHSPATCTSGSCTPHPFTDGTACGAADSCHSAPTCTGGSCSPHPLADGTACGAADSCHSAPTCASGTCTPRPLADGTVCAPTGNICQNSGTCSGGACGAITNKGAGTVCSPAANACHTNGTCDGSGNCGAQGTYGDGYSYDGVYLDRCCGGVPSRIDTAANCGACGINCNGAACNFTRNQYYCGCNSNAQCWSGCCSTFYGTPWMCAAGNCSTNLMIPCPGNATNGNNNNPGGPYYCHY